MKSKNKVRLLVIPACFLFVLSIFSPFLEATWVDGIIPEMHESETFWSFKHSVASWNSWGGGWGTQDWWFADYWHEARLGRGALEAWIGPALIFMLEAQVLTVLLAVLAIIKGKLYLLLSSAILNGFTTLCMWFFSQALSSLYSRTLTTGFWLTLPSAALLLAASILSWRQFKPARHDVRAQNR